MKRFVALLLLSAAPIAAQHAQPVDPTKCDSILAGAKVDDVETGLFLSVRRADGGLLADDHMSSIILNVGAAFVPPRPFRLSVFAGPPLLRTLRAVSSDTANLRAPTLTGVYRVSSKVGDSAAKVFVIRQSLLPGFDDAAVDAIRAASLIQGLMLPPVGEDSMLFDVRFETDSMPGARRLVSAKFPRMQVFNAVAQAGNPSAVYPPAALADSVSGEVVLRFIVGRDGSPILGTAEVIRATYLDFVRSAVEALHLQRFTPATIAGCAVSQVVEYPFSFNPPQSPPRH